MRIVFFFIVLVTGMQASAMAMQAKPFGVWLQELKTEASSKGISDGTLNAALTDIEPVARIIELDRAQPESTLTFSQYVKKVINQKRIETGRALYRQHKTLLQEVSKHYGVQPEFIVALWGIETNYGQNMGTYNVPEALATLAYDGRRSEFFRKELFNALQIIDAGHIDAYDMVGSWAGAMGQCQFMPSSFNNFAEDYNEDGKRDIWNSQPDVFASIANYLSKSGWEAQESWGIPVRLPTGFDETAADIDHKQSVAEWSKLGITLENGTALPEFPGEGWVIFADSNDNTHPHLIYNNYKVILKWNRSRYFATAVGILANQIKQGDS